MSDKKNQKIGITEVVLRDGHQSLLATRFHLALAAFKENLAFMTGTTS